MASLIEELIDILQKEYEVYQELVPIVEQKTQVIVKNDLVSLQDITGKEQSAIDNINMLEHKREAVMKDIKTVISRKTDLNLQTLIKLMDKQPKEQRALSLVHDNLKNTIQRLVQANNRNKSLIKHSLEMIEFNMNFIQSTRMSPGNNTYTRGAAQYMAQSPGTGMFDAKQ